MSENVYETISHAIFSFDADETARSAKELLDKGISANKVVDALTQTLKEVGDKFDKGEFFLMHLVSAAMAAKTALTEVLEPELRKSGEKRVHLGKVVIGTVSGDIHDIGKSIVSAMLFTAGFEVYDLGADVQTDEFIENVRNVNADILGLSALLSTTMPVQRDIIEALKAAGLRDRVKVMIGGAPVTKEWAEEIGADGYAEDAIEGVRVAKRLMNVERE